MDRQTLLAAIDKFLAEGGTVVIVETEGPELLEFELEIGRHFWDGKDFTPGCYWIQPHAGS